MCLSSERILGDGFRPVHALPLYSVAQIRAMESAAAASLPPHTLMQRAGLALARLTLAVAPHARTVWIACGPGNNGGDGFEAATHLIAWGKNVSISHLAPVEYAQDASKSIAKAIAAGVRVGTEPPAAFDVCIDALFGVGIQRPLSATHAAWVGTMRASGKPIVAADCPSGLDADTGCAQSNTVHAHATLTFLGLKPGLFTNTGRDSCGDIWLDTLLVPNPPHALAQLNPPALTQPRLHASHKGSYGDVAVVGGDAGMWGAALLAARAALHHGAGRVYVSPLDPMPRAGFGRATRADVSQPAKPSLGTHSRSWPGAAAELPSALASRPLVTKAAQLGTRRGRTEPTCCRLVDLRTSSIAPTRYHCAHPSPAGGCATAELQYGPSAGRPPPGSANAG